MSDSAILGWDPMRNAIRAFGKMVVSPRRESHHTIVPTRSSPGLALGLGEEACFMGGVGMVAGSPPWVSWVSMAFSSRP